MTAAGYGNAQVQKFVNKSIGGTGYQISTKTLRPATVQKVRAALDARFGNGPTVPGTKNFSSTSIGPTFGKTVAKSAVIAIIASLLVISAYIALRFEWKYAVPVLIALMHDLLITAGVYSLTGREVTTATVAALLTILGYSLYDTIIVFDRVRENVPRMPRAAFSQIVNRSMSEVLTRSLATSFCTLLPVISLLLFGGETLKNFAFALMVGIASGAYSSIFIASPVLTHWKEREGSYRQRRARIVRELGQVPAYATTVAGEPEDVEPAQKRKRTRRGSLIAPEDPGEQLSREEFQELVRDLDVDVQPTSVGTTDQGSASRSAGARVAQRPPAAEPEPDAEEHRDPAADLTPEDLVLKDEPKRREKRRRPRQAGPPASAANTGGRADGNARLGDDGLGDLALHDLPAGPFLGRNRGSVRGVARRGGPHGADHLRRESLGALMIPGENATDIAVVLYAVPGALIGIAAGLRGGHAARTRGYPATSARRLLAPPPGGSVSRCAVVWPGAECPLRDPRVP